MLQITAFPLSLPNQCAIKCWSFSKRTCLPSSARQPAQAEFQRAWEQELLTRLVALNAQRAAEESQCPIRHLRPGYQKKKDEAGKTKPEQTSLALQPGTKNRFCQEASLAKVPRRPPRRHPPLKYPLGWRPVHRAFSE
jgi:hypothetical protein